MSLSFPSAFDSRHEAKTRFACRPYPCFVMRVSSRGVRVIVPFLQERAFYLVSFIYPRVMATYASRKWDLGSEHMHDHVFVILFTGSFFPPKWWRLRISVTTGTASIACSLVRKIMFSTIIFYDLLCWFKDEMKFRIPNLKFGKYTNRDQTTTCTVATVWASLIRERDLGYISRHVVLPRR